MSDKKNEQNVPQELENSVALNEFEAVDDLDEIKESSYDAVKSSSESPEKVDEDLSEEDFDSFDSMDDDDLAAISSVHRPASKRSGSGKILLIGGALFLFVGAGFSITRSRSVL